MQTQRAPLCEMLSTLRVCFDERLGSMPFYRDRRQGCLERKGWLMVEKISRCTYVCKMGECFNDILLLLLTYMVNCDFGLLLELANVADHFHVVHVPREDPSIFAAFQLASTSS